MFEINDVEKYMELAIKEAEIAAECGDVPVGAVIVDEKGNVVSKAHNTRKALGLIHGHAEINAINNAGLLPGQCYSMFVTLEPCPMCTGAIIDAGISAVYYGAQNTTNGALGTVMNVALNNKIDVFGGFKEAACSDLIKLFFADLRNQ